MIKQIKIGFAKSDKKHWIYACSSVTLIKDGKNVVLVDCGGRGFFDEIKKNLKKEGVLLGDVTHVVNTHSHLDHIWNSAFFKNADFINSGGILKKKFYWKKLPLKIGRNIEVIFTPGHSNDSCSVVFRKEKKVYCVVGDLFYSDANKLPSFEKNVKEIMKNRKKILKIADFIIPGHGKIFEVNNGT
jgi:glyoxylase-like metal-dependent hydrolase (beta-lactamase superfamily II)